MNTAIENKVSAEEKIVIMNKLVLLLAGQTAVYTAGNSGSVRNETASLLLESVMYVLGIDENLSNEAAKRLINTDINSEFQKGIRRIENKIKCAAELYRRVCKTLPEIRNVSLNDTILNLGVFRKNYDYRLFAAKIPCDIDYQLAVPVPESLKGIDYIIRYLENLYCENRFINCFNPEDCIPVLNKFCPDYNGLLINLFEPLAANALVLEALGKSVSTFEVTENDREKLELLFGGMSRDKVALILQNSAKRLAEKQKITGKKYSDYLCVYAFELSERVFLLKDKGGLKGIFL